MKLARVEDRPTPKEVYGWRIYFNAFIATFAAMMIGYAQAHRSCRLVHTDKAKKFLSYDSAFIGTSISLASFRKEFGLDLMSDGEVDTIEGNIVSTYQAGYDSNATRNELLLTFL